MKVYIRSILIGIVFIELSLTLFFHLAHRQIQTVAKPKEEEQVLATYTLKENPVSPLRLIIPAISVNAHVQHLGVTPQGKMEVPDNTVDVGWFDIGPQPGEKGNAVITGHYNGEGGENGVLRNLDKLKPGDTIQVINDLGINISFVVRESRTYNPGYADEVFSPNDNGTHLNLITCDGYWDEVKKEYSKRLVVFTDIVN